MKKIMVLAMTLLTTPLFAGVNCMTNSKDLSEGYDTKEWHYADCSCDCEYEIVKGGHCTECGHLQDAHTYTIAKAPYFAKATKGKQDDKITQLPTIRIPDNPQNILRQLAAQYLMNK